MKYILKNKEIELTTEEVAEIVKQNQNPVEEKKLGIAIKSVLGNIIFQSTKTTYKEAIIEKGDANLPNADLSNANLRNADLRNANLSNANLPNADLSNADLSNANLSNANLPNADLSNADLSNANLRNADLRGADLSNADLQNAKFYGRGGTKMLKREQLPVFLGALGFIIEE